MDFARIITVVKHVLTHGVKTSSPTESFMKIVRETQIKPIKFYLENAMHQSLCENYAFNSYMPKVTVIGQLPPQENNDENRQTQSPCPSNLSDYLHVADNY